MGTNDSLGVFLRCVFALSVGCLFGVITFLFLKDQQDRQKQVTQLQENNETYTSQLEWALALSRQEAEKCHNAKP